MSLDLYRLPIGLSDGVLIELPKTDIRFLVRLPATSNEEYTNAMMADMNIHVDPMTGTVPDIEMNPNDFRVRQKKVFAEVCVLKMDGVPEQYKTAAEFFKEYPLAERYIFETALELAEVADREIEAALGKS